MSKKYVYDPPLEQQKAHRHLLERAELRKKIKGNLDFLLKTNQISEEEHKRALQYVGE